MEERLSSPTDQEHAAALGRALVASRKRAKEFLATQAQQLNTAQTLLDEQLQRIADELATARAAVAASQAELLAHSDELHQHTAAVEQLEHDLHERELKARAEQEQAAAAQQTIKQQLAAQEADLQRRLTEVEAAGAKLRQAQRQLETAQEEHDAEREQLARRRQKLDEQSRTLEAEREAHEAQAAETKAQRVRIAAQFKEQRARHRQEMQQLQEQFAADRARQAEEDPRLLALGNDKAALEAQCAEQLAKLTEQERTAEQLRADLEASSAELASFQETLELAAQAARQQQHEAHAALLAERQAADARCRELEQELTAQQADLLEESSRLISQAEEIARLQEHLDQAREQMAGRSSSDHGHADELRRLHEASAARERELARQIERLQQELATAAAQVHAPIGASADLAEYEQLQTEVEQLRLELQRSAAADAGNEDLVDRLSTERDQLASERDRVAARRDELARQLEEAQQASSGAGNPVDARKIEDMQRRFELAVEDVRDLKRRNAELEEKLSRSKSAATQDSGGAMDWESQKRRLLATLEADDGSLPQPDRMTIEGTIRITDDVVAQKDREISDLKEMLSQKSDSVAETTIGASALSGLLDTDEIIQQQRQALEELQTQWREKLRQAEIDSSVERARLARERASIEEKLQAYEAEKAQFAKDGPPPAPGDKKPQRGRWLSRLGLKDE